MTITWTISELIAKGKTIINPSFIIKVKDQKKMENLVDLFICNHENKKIKNIKNFNYWALAAYNASEKFYNQICQ